jgi:hypothetical protein
MKLPALIVPIVLLSSAALAQTPAASQPSIDQIVRARIAGLSAAQELLLQIPDLVEENKKLTAQVRELQAKTTTPEAPK